MPVVRISGFSLIFPAVAVFSAHFSEGTQILRLLGKESKNQKPLLISKEKVNKALNQSVSLMLLRLRMHFKHVSLGASWKVPCMGLVLDSRVCIRSWY